MDNKTSKRWFFHFCFYLYVTAAAGMPVNAIAQSWTPAILKSDVFLPDFSYAGYYWGEKPLPILKPTMDVTEFGAIANDGKDDTDAIRTAIKAAEKMPGTVVLHFPAGKFELRDILYIERSDFVLQGEGSGPDGTVFHIARPLGDMDVPWSVKWLKAYYFLFGKRTHGKLFSTFSWTGGVFWVRLPHKQDTEDLDIELVEGKRNQHKVRVKNTAAVQPGDVVTLQWYNHDGEQGSLLKDIYGDYPLPMGRRLYGWFWNPIMTQPLTVEHVQDEYIYFKEPLLFDLRPEWTPKLVKPTYLKHVGIENISIEFPDTQYAGHHLEEGFNAIYFTGAMHSWIRNVSIHNADSAILSKHCKNITMEGITTTGRPGHYTIHTGKSYGVLVKNFNLQSPAIHNPSFNTKATLCVYSGGTLGKAKLDQHRGINNQNLFDNIDIDEAEDIFTHGGARYWGPTAGRFNTFWNIRIKNAPPDGFIGRCDEAPEARLIGIVGLNGDVNFDYEPAPYIEGLNKKGIAVPSLYQYQLEKRLSRGK